MDLSMVTDTLVRGPDGIWSRGSATEKHVHFPERGHAECFRIEDDSFWFAHRNELISAALRRAGAWGPFLDVGGGNGVVSRRLEADGIPCVLLEPLYDERCSSCGRVSL